MNDLLEVIDLLSSDHVYRPVMDRMPDEPGLYFIETNAGEKIVLSRSQIIKIQKHINYWLEPVPKRII
jgi:hypothetical protein